MTLINKNGTLLYKHSKNNSLLKRTLTLLKLKPLISRKKIMKQYVVLHPKFNSWLKKAGVMRMHLPSISNVMKFLQKDFQKTSIFANKRQIEHTSTVLEPSIPFHTLVKLVDAEDIANDKTTTHDLAFEIKNITKTITHPNARPFITRTTYV